MAGRRSGEGADGTSGVVAAVTNGAGTIGYADASQAGDLGKAHDQGRLTSYVGPTAEAAAKVVEALDAGRGPVGRGDMASEHRPHHDRAPASTRSCWSPT